MGVKSNHPATHCFQKNRFFIRANYGAKSGVFPTEISGGAIEMRELRQTTPLSPSAMRAKLKKAV
jgi:hypothetical protein